MSNTKNSMTDAARLARLSAGALRTLNTMNDHPANYFGQASTDAVRSELVDANLVTINYGGNIADPAATRIYTTKLGKRIASKALAEIRSR